jgi:K+ transporter
VTPPRPVTEAWRHIVHHVIHPVSGAIVLAAAGVEALDWLQAALDHVGRLAVKIAGG